MYIYIVTWGGQYCQLISQQQECMGGGGELTGITVEPKGSSSSHGERAIAETGKCSV